MTEESRDYVPISGSCSKCGCALGCAASRKKEEWYCCGECGTGDPCVCGCRSLHERPRPSNLYVPGRRMFASRHPDYLNTPADFVQKARAFPFAERADRGSAAGPARRRPSEG